MRVIEQTIMQIRYDAQFSRLYLSIWLAIRIASIIEVVILPPYHICYMLRAPNLMKCKRKYAARKYATVDMINHSSGTILKSEKRRSRHKTHYTNWLLHHLLSDSAL